MAIRFIDSFDHYESSDIDKKYGFTSGGPSILTTSGRRGGGALSLSTFNIVRPSVTANPTYVIGLAVWISGANIFDLIQFREGATVHMALETRFDQKLYAMHGNGTEVGASTSSELNQSSWNYFEVKCFVNGSTGTFQVWKNGALVDGLNLSSQNTANGGTPTIDNISLSGASSVTLRIDDLVILDTTGNAPYDDRIGDVRIDALMPDGDGATNNFTAVGSGTTNADRVDETPAIDDDTTYVHSSTVNNVDLWTLGNLPASPGAATVFGAQGVLTAKKDDSGTRDIAVIARPVTTNRIGATQSLSTDYIMYKEMWQISPETSLAWTESEIDGTELGVEVAT